jgi:hypothetical protein
VPMDFYVRDLWSSTFWEKNFWYEVLWWVHTPCCCAFLEIKYVLYCVEKSVWWLYGEIWPIHSCFFITDMYVDVINVTVTLPKVMPIEWLIWTFRIL